MKCLLWQVLSVWECPNIMSGKLTTISVGWVERSETQHQLSYLLSFVTWPCWRNISLHGESFDITLSAMTTFYSFVKRSTTESVFGMLTYISPTASVNETQHPESYNAAVITSTRSQRRTNQPPIKVIARSQNLISTRNSASGRVIAALVRWVECDRVTIIGIILYYVWLITHHKNSICVGWVEVTKPNKYGSLCWVYGHSIAMPLGFYPTYKYCGWFTGHNIRSGFDFWLGAQRH